MFTLSFHTGHIAVTLMTSLDGDVCESDTHCGERFSKRCWSSVRARTRHYNRFHVQLVPEPHQGCVEISVDLAASPYEKVASAVSVGGADSEEDEDTVAFDLQQAENQRVEAELEVQKASENILHAKQQKQKLLDYHTKIVQELKQEEQKMLAVLQSHDEILRTEEKRLDDATQKRKAFHETLKRKKQKLQQSTETLRSQVSQAELDLQSLMTELRRRQAMLASVSEATTDTAGKKCRNID